MTTRPMRVTRLARSPRPLRSRRFLSPLTPWPRKALATSRWPRFGWLSWFRGIWSIALILILGLPGCTSVPVVEAAIVRVQQVLSGQVLEVLATGSQAGRVERVRLLGLDAPDLRQDPWGLEAREALQRWLSDKTVRLEFDGEGRDRGNRLLAYVWLDDRLVNEQAIAEGYALATTRQPLLRYGSRLNQAQERARLLELGIWNPARPLRLSPAEFRRQYPQ